MNTRPQSPTPAPTSPRLAPPDPGTLVPLREAIRAFVLGRIRNPALADDITQEILLRLHRNFHTLRAGGKLEVWVFRIARNAVADHFRAVRPGEPFDKQSHASPPGPASHEPLAAEEEVAR